MQIGSWSSARRDHGVVENVMARHRATYESEAQECQARVSYKSYSEERHTQECQARVSQKREVDLCYCTIGKKEQPHTLPHTASIGVGACSHTASVCGAREKGQVCTAFQE